ncbi:hypothetical protein WJX82_001957 [Trebouxia sp. C0006]
MSLKGPLLSAVESQDNAWCLVGPEGPAIASILHHLDIYSSHQLARTCRTCAREAAHYRTHYKRDYCAKILPSVQSVAGTCGDRYPYDHKVSSKRMNVMEWSHHRVGHGNM